LRSRYALGPLTSTIYRTQFIVDATEVCTLGRQLCNEISQLMLSIRTWRHIGNRTVNVDKAYSDGLSEPEHVALASATAAPSIHRQSPSSKSPARALPAHTSDSNSMSAMQCTIVDPSSSKDQTQVRPVCVEMQSTLRLIGTLIVSPYQAVDEHGVTGTFFVFPDLSCRTPGCYRLCFKLLRIDMHNMRRVYRRDVRPWNAYTE
jgi:hypothetical protein